MHHPLSLQNTGEIARLQWRRTIDQAVVPVTNLFRSCFRCTFHLALPAHHTTAIVTNNKLEFLLRLCALVALRAALYAELRLHIYNKCFCTKQKNYLDLDVDMAIERSPRVHEHCNTVLTADDIRSTDDIIVNGDRMR